MKFFCSVLLCLLAWNFSVAQCSISGPTTVFPNNVSTYSIPSSLGQCGNCYDWDIIGGGGTIIGSDTGNSVSIRKDGNSNLTIRVTYFSDSGCRSCTLLVTTPSGGCTYTTNIDNNYFDNYTEILLITYDSPNIPSGASYSWSVNYNFGPTFNTTTNSTVVTVPLPSGRSIVNASVTVSYQGCTFSDSHIYFPPITSGFGLNSETGPEATFQTQNIEVYPNPTTGEFNFTGLDVEGNTVSILNLEGKEIIRDAMIDQPLDISDYPAGVYHYLIRNDKEIVKTGKIMKE